MKVLINFICYKKSFHLLIFAHLIKELDYLDHTDSR